MLERREDYEALRRRILAEHASDRRAEQLEEALTVRTGAL
jgi:hypothetical protein